MGVFLLRLMILAALGAAAVSDAQIYEWLDENGERQFSDHPPEHAEYRLRTENEGKLTTYSPVAVPSQADSRAALEAGKRRSPESVPQSSSQSSSQSS
ncbi:MAG: DUF4124 domain-containing protein, partial [Wenzhouxiangellaceae bacterium]|nr:DUF4124 domain-containing protein [Wenzhouxiangellaceae bacterium]